MKRIRDILRRMLTTGLAAAVLTVSIPSVAYTSEELPYNTETADLSESLLSGMAAPAEGDTGNLPVDLTVDELIYDGTIQSITVRNGSNKFSSDNYSVEFLQDGKEASPKNAGAYTAVLTGKGSYSGTEFITFNILPRGAQLQWSGTEFTYNGENKCPTATVANLINGDTCSVTVIGEQIDANSGGSSYTATATKLSNSNYRLPEKVTIAFTIAKAPSPVLSGNQIPTAKILEYTYYEQELINAGTVPSGYTMKYAVTDDDTAPSDSVYDTALPKRQEAGSYYVWYKAEGDSNHEDSEAGRVIVTIDKAGIPDSDIAPEPNTDLYYVDKPHKLITPNTAVVTGGAIYYAVTKDETAPPADDKSTAEADRKWKKAVPERTEAGSYYVWYKAVGDERHKDTDPKNVPVTIKGKSLTITAKAQSVEAGADPESGKDKVTLSDGSLIDGHELKDVAIKADSTAVVTTTGVITPEKAKIMRGTTDVTANYDITYKAGTLTVTNAPVYISGIKADNREYDGSIKATVSGTPVLRRVSNDAVVTGLTVSDITAGFSDKNAGSGKAVTVTGGVLDDSSNYTLDIAATNKKLALKADIKQKPVTVTATGVNRVYKKGNIRTTLSVGNLLGVLDDEEVIPDASAAVGIMADAGAGTDKPVTVTGLSITGADAGNYQLMQPLGVTVTISKADPESASAEVPRTFLYTEEAKDSIDVAALLPSDSGTVEWLKPVTEGNISCKGVPAVSDGILSYTLNKSDGDKNGTIRVTAVMQNYNDFTVTVNIRQIALSLYEKKGNDYEACPSKKLDTGRSITLVPMFANGTILNNRVVWSSTNPDAAIVTQDGKVTALSGGSTMIRVQSEEKPGLIAYCTINVTEEVTDVSLNKKKVSLGTGESMILTAQILPFTADQKLIWTKDNDNVKIEVSKDTLSAKITGTAAGKTKVTATSGDGKKSAGCSFVIGDPVNDFAIAGKGNASGVKAGKTLAIQVKWNGTKPKNTDINWYVSDADGGDASYIASISGKGVLTGIMAGRVVVTAVSAANPNKSASAAFTVTAADKGPEITDVCITNADKLNKGLGIGKSVALKTKLTLSGDGKASGDAVAWVSSDSSIATVSQKGVVKAVSPGKVTIIAIPRNAADINAAPKDSVAFTVFSLVKSVKPDKKRLTVGTRNESKYGKIAIAKVVPEDATDPAIKWTANNKNVQLAAILADDDAADGNFAQAGADVTIREGEVLAVKAVTPGVTKLTGMTVDGSKKKVHCTVTVRGQVTRLALKTNTGKNGFNDVTDKGEGRYTAIMKAGTGMKLTPVISINGMDNTAGTKKIYEQYKKYTDTGVSYLSSDTSVLTVNKNGRISTKKDAAGKSATVYVTSSDGKHESKIVITIK